MSISDEVPDFEIEDPDFETFAGISDENIFEFEDEDLDFENEVPDFETVEDMATRKNGKQFADEVPDFDNEDEDFARKLLQTAETRIMRNHLQTADEHFR